MIQGNIKLKSSSCLLTCSIIYFSPSFSFTDMFYYLKCTILNISVNRLIGFCKCTIHIWYISLSYSVCDNRRYPNDPLAASLFPLFSNWALVFQSVNALSKWRRTLHICLFYLCKMGNIQPLFLLFCDVLLYFTRVQ